MEHRVNIVVVFVLCVALESHAQVSCTAPGRYPDPTDTTCRNYTLCYLTSNSTYLPYNYVCPSITIFNPTIAQCTSPSTYTCNVTLPLCTANGYIPDPNSSNCSTFIECVDLYGNGTYSESTLNCPEGTFYNPSSTFCEPGYNCAITSTPSTLELPTTTTTPTTLTTPVPTTSTTVASTTTTTLTPTTTTTSTTPAPTTPAPTFTCSTTGRFANTTDTSCQRYYYCVLNPNGTFAQYNYICPSTSVFSPITGLCTASYRCPFQ